jgi:hypothetical protein
MKQVYPLRLSAILLCICALFASCTKSGGGGICQDPIALTIAQNGPIVEGWPLYLESDVRTEAYLYKWTGPNGWKQHYTVFSNDAWHQEIPDMTAANAGEYKLLLMTHDGCVKYEGSVNVNVIPAPTPPCTIAANTSTSSVAGVGGFNFVNRTFQGGSGHYLVYGSQVTPGGDYMRFAFLGDNPPLPGVYKTNGFFGMEPGKVGLYIETITYQFVANPDQLVYVNKVNNKLEVTFCGVKFNNPINPANPITISARITQP